MLRKDATSDGNINVRSFGIYFFLTLFIFLLLKSDNALNHVLPPTFSKTLKLRRYVLHETLAAQNTSQQDQIAFVILVVAVALETMARPCYEVDLWSSSIAMHLLLPNVSCSQTWASPITMSSGL
jgi:hypothetical protein